MASVNSNNYNVGSPLEGILKALEIAHTYYGIKSAKAAADTLAQHQDPNSDYSKTRQAATTAGINMMVNKGFMKPEEASPLLSSIKEQSGESLDKLSETSPLFQMANKDAQLQYLTKALENRTASTKERNELSANKDYAKTMAPYETTIQAANRADHIIEQIKEGKLKSTPTLKTDLSGALGQMFNNGKSATVYSMSHGDVDSAYGRIQKGLGFISNSAVDTIPMDQLDQMQKDVHSLRDSYADAHDTTYQSFREGLPERMRQSLDTRFNTFRTKALAKAEPSGSGMPGMASAQAGTFSPHPQDSEAVTWAKQNPKDPRASKILQMNGGGQ